MKNIISKILLPIAILSFASPEISGQNVATNVRVKIDNEKVEFTYDIPSTDKITLYSVFVNTNDLKIQPKRVTGIGEKIPYGIDRKITWNYASDGYTKEQVSNLKLGVTATYNKKATDLLFERETGLKRTRNISLIGAGSCAVVGLGALGYGFTENGKANDDYNIYKENTDRRSDVYGGDYEARDALYKKANDRHKKAQYLMAGGGVLIAGGAVWAWSALRRYKQMKGAGNFGFLDPETEGWSLLVDSPAPVSVGVGLRLRF